MKILNVFTCFIFLFSEVFCERQDAEKMECVWKSAGNFRVR